MDKSGYTDMTSIQILVFFALVIIIAVYVTVTNNRRKQNLIIKKLKNGWTNKRDKYEEAHRAELTLWNAASRYLHANLPKGTKTLPIAEWEQEYADLKTQRDSDYTKLKETRAEVAELQKIRRCVDIALRADQPEQTQSRTKRHDIDR